MQITKVPTIKQQSIKSQNVSLKPSFGYRLPNDTFEDIRDIPKLHCAICGEAMLTQDDLNEFLLGFRPNSKRALNSKAISQYKDTNAYIILKELSEKSPNKRLNKIVKEAEDKKIFEKLDKDTIKDIKKIVKISENLSIRAPQAIKRFEKIRPMLGKEKNEVLDMLEIYSLKYPDESFSEIIQRPEVFKYHYNLKEKNEKAISLKKIKTLKKIKELSDTMSISDKRKVQVANNNAIEKINNVYLKTDIKQFLIEDIYTNLVKECTDKKTARKILKESKKLPYKNDEANKLIVDCAKANYDDHTILKIIAEDALSTFEHIKAKSKNGEDIKSNGIALHKHCNQERSNIPYPIFLKYKPEMKSNIQKQISKIITFINRDKLKEYDSYPIEVKETLIQETNNKIKINIKKYINYKALQSQNKLDRALASLEENKKKYDIADKKLKETEKELEKIMQQVRELKKTKARYIASLENANQNIESYENTVTKAKEELNNIQELNAKDDILDSKK